MDLRKFAKWSLKAVTPQKTRPDISGPTTLPFLEVGNWNSKYPKLKEKKLAPVDFAEAMSLKVGDLVRVLFGKDAGNDGVIRSIDRANNQCIVAGCNMTNITRNPELPKSHDKTKHQSYLVSSESPIHLTNVQPLDPVLKKPTRLKTRMMLSGELVRISKLSRCAMPEPVAVYNEPSAPVLKKHVPPSSSTMTTEQMEMLAAVSARLSNRS
jgi:ribosomal protein L24